MSTNFSHTARVIRADQVTPLIKHFSFERVDGKPFSPFSAGSHVVIGMNNGTNTHKNPYSLVGLQCDSTQLVVVVPCSCIIILN
jgi:ferredoxin-NADP reductase